MADMEIDLNESARLTLAELSKGRKADPAKARKVIKTLRILAENPHHPGLATHRYDAFDKTFGRTIWESYVENNTPSAWRIWWYFGPASEQITVVLIGPHP